MASPEGAGQVESSAPGARPQGAPGPGGGLFAAEDHGEVEESVSAGAMEWPDHGHLQWKRQADSRQVPPSGDTEDRGGA